VENEARLKDCVVQSTNITYDIWEVFAHTYRSTECCERFLSTLPHRPHPICLTFAHVSSGAPSFLFGMRCLSSPYCCSSRRTTEFTDPLGHVFASICRISAIRRIVLPPLAVGVILGSKQVCLLACLLVTLGCLLIQTSQAHPICCGECNEAKDHVE
jgi:hypothetical protein